MAPQRAIFVDWALGAARSERRVGVAVGWCAILVMVIPVIPVIPMMPSDFAEG
jgi:hypothetical protein